LDRRERVKALKPLIHFPKSFAPARRPSVAGSPKSQRVVRLTNEDEVGPAAPVVPVSVAHSSLPTWRLVLLLAVPALAQQCLLLAVSLSDRFLAGHVRVLSPAEEAAAAGVELLGLGGFAPDQSGTGLLPQIARSEAALELSRQMNARPADTTSDPSTGRYFGCLYMS